MNKMQSYATGTQTQDIYSGVKKKLFSLKLKTHSHKIYMNIWCQE